MDDFKPLNLFEEEVPNKSTNESEVQDTTSELLSQAYGEHIAQEDSVSESADSDDSKSVNENDDLSDYDSNETVQDVVEPRCVEKLDCLDARCEKITQKLADLEQLFNKRIMHADYEDKIIDQLHSELQKYKDDMYSQLIRPILIDIIEVRDSILRIAATYQKKPEGEQDIPNKTFSDYSYDLQDILEKNNVEIYRSEAGDDFTPIKQRAIKKEVTHEEYLHGKIAESLSSGYYYKGRVISAEKVSVYYYEKENEHIIESEEINNG